MIQKKVEDTTQQSPVKPEIEKPVRARRTKTIKPTEEPAEIIEPLNDTIITEIIEETITISDESNNDTVALPNKKDSKKNTKKKLKMKDKDKKKAKKADAKQKAKAKAKKAKKAKKDKAKKAKVKAKIKAKKAKAKSKKAKKSKKNKKNKK
jgi:hypothetical protein